MRFTLDFFPEAGCEVEGVGIVGDGELAGGAGSSSEEADFSLGVGGNAVAESGQRHVAEDL